MRRHGRSLSATLLAVLAAAALAACGSSSKSSSSSSGSSGGGSQASSDPQTLLKQTFTDHAVKSGKLDISFTITPHGSSVISTPLSLEVTGPYQSHGSKPPDTDLTMTFSGLNKKGTLGFVTTGGAAFLRLQGSTYKLPASASESLRKSFAQNGASGSEGLASLGIDPSNLVANPKIVGTDTLDGTTVEHLQGAVNVNALLSDVDKLLAKQNGANSSVPTKIPDATAKKIVAAIHNPTLNIWTGKSDTILRRMTLTASVPVSGDISTRLGGLTSADFSLDARVTDVNQPQTVSAPANAQSYAALQTKLQGLGAQLEGALAGAAGGGASSGSGSSGSSAAATQKYSKCVQKAAGDVTKMQKCASLLNSGG